jgi:peptidoglycan hydrolase CwlO-like protein
MEINEKKLKNILDKQRQEYQNYLGVMVEDFKSQVRLIAEQYDSIRAKLDSHTETLNSHTEMIVSMKEDIEIMKVDIAFIKSGLKKKVDYEEFEELVKRVAILEAKK